MVVFRNHEHVGVGAIDGARPVERVLVHVFALDRVNRLVVDRQIHLEQVNELNLEVATSGRDFVEPLCDRDANATGTSTADDYL